MRHEGYEMSYVTHFIRDQNLYNINTLLKKIIKCPRDTDYFTDFKMATTHHKVVGDCLNDPGTTTSYESCLRDYQYSLGTATC